jgi:hypothetical protein
LEEFHTTFHKHCKRYFPKELLFERCCEEFYSRFQHAVTCSSSSENERGYVNEEVEEDSIIHEYFSNFVFQEEYFQDVIDANVVNNMNVDSFDVSISSCCDEYVVTNSYEDRDTHEKDMSVNGTDPCLLLLTSLLWKNFIQRSISIVRGIFPRNFFLNIVVKNVIHIFSIQ